MPRYSIVIPAFNEEAFLGGTLELLAEAMSGSRYEGEVVVTDNNSTDRTAEIARKHGAKVVHEPVNQIARARNTGAAAASQDSEWLVFLDADTELPPDTLRKALDLLASGNCVGGGAIVKTDQAMPFPVACFLASWNRAARVFGWAAGCFIFCRRDAFEAARGFDERVYAGEEVWFSNAIRKWGRKRNLKFRILVEPPVVTSGRKANWYSAGEFLRQLSLLLLFPWATRYRRFCKLWYHRPDRN